MELINKPNQERDNMQNCCENETPYWRIGETEAKWVEVGDLITISDVLLKVTEVQHYLFHNPEQKMVNIKGISGHKGYGYDGDFAFLADNDQIIEIH
jgi:hypothetical protein|tara:strand:+ start:6705 stop:6995 length:291 start_codon:yes stop_codon:yes gene_type:complete